MINKTNYDIKQIKSLSQKCHQGVDNREDVNTSKEKEQTKESMSKAKGKTHANDTNEWATVITQNNIL